MNGRFRPSPSSKAPPKSNASSSAGRYRACASSDFGAGGLPSAVVSGGSYPYFHPYNFRGRMGCCRVWPYRTLSKAPLMPRSSQPRPFPSLSSMSPPYVSARRSKAPTRQEALRLFRICAIALVCLPLLRIAGLLAKGLKVLDHQPPLHHSDGHSVELSDAAAAGLRELLEAIADGDASVVVRRASALTTQQVADMLSVSRPHVVKLIDRGDNPSHMVGAYRRGSDGSAGLRPGSVSEERVHQPLRSTLRSAVRRFTSGKMGRTPNGICPWPHHPTRRSRRGCTGAYENDSTARNSRATRTPHGPVLALSLRDLGANDDAATPGLSPRLSARTPLH
jgi:excisionase family DNA binding protein